MAKVEASSAAAMFPSASLVKPSLLPLDILSVFHDTTSAAESLAFSRLMRHIKETDEEHGTIIMVQVENEVGVLEDSRDRSRAAQEAFDSEVPELLARFLTDELKTLHPALRKNLETFERNVKEGPSHSSWSHFFGESDQIDEIFMAYHYARYVETIASAGKKEYGLPMFTNAWLRSDQTVVKDDEQSGTAPAALVTNGARPGEYPSGGPIETVLDVWQLVAKSLDFISPDCYFQDYGRTCANFSHRSQPLFIPEQRTDGVGAIRIWEAIGTFGALGASPFGIDSVPDELNGFPPHLELLSRVGPIILRARQMGQSMRGFYFDEYEKDSPDPSPAKRFRMGDWNVLVERAFVCGHPAAGYGMIIQIEHDRFLLIGAGFQVKITPSDPDAFIFGIASCQEKQVVKRDTGSDTEFTLETLRWLNGDETRQGGYTVMPTENPDYGDVPIAKSIPARTKIAECQPYVVREKVRE